MTGSESNSSDKDVEDPIKLKEDDKPSKFLRVITVSAYIFSVSFAALMLSLYYIFIWNPTREHSERLESPDNHHHPAETLVYTHH